MARIWRQGQKRPCFIYRFLTTGCLDEHIWMRAITKQGLAGSMMNDPGSNGGDAFSPAELKALFQINLNTACVTHDLLQCGCLTGEQPGIGNVEDGEAEDDDDELMELEVGFMPASQVPDLGKVLHPFSPSSGSPIDI